MKAVGISPQAIAALDQVSGAAREIANITTAHHRRLSKKLPKGLVATLTSELHAALVAHVIGEERDEL